MMARWMSTRAALYVIEQSGVELEIGVDQLTQALRAGDVLSRATLLVDRISEEETQLVDLPPQVWRHFQPLSRSLSPIKVPHWCEWERRSTGGWIAIDVVVRESDIDRIWTKRQPEKAGGGRPPAELWVDIAVEATRIVYVEGVPATQAELVRRLLEACRDSLGGTQIKAFASKFMKAVRLIENEETE